MPEALILEPLCLFRVHSQLKAELVLSVPIFSEKVFASGQSCLPCSQYKAFEELVGKGALCLLLTC